jgi:hypothetical protein
MQDNIIKRLLRTVKDDIFDVIISLFNMPEIKNIGKSKLPLVSDPIQFVKREKYPDHIVNMTLEFLVEFVKEVLGERSDDSSEGAPSLSNTSKTKSNSNNGPPFDDATPLLVIFDTV